MSDSAKVDLYFLADATGSMRNCIDNVKSNIVDTYLKARQCSSSDIEMGIGFYRDINSEGDIEEYGVLQGITRQRSLLNRAVDSLAENVQGGGDDPESQLYALTQIGDESKNDRVAPGRGENSRLVW